VRRLLTATAILAALSTSSCQTMRHNVERAYRGECGGGDPRPWARLRSAPDDAEPLRRAADRNRVFPADNAYRTEDWFIAPDGDRLLCRTSGDSPRNACVGAWWAFHSVDGRPVVTAKDGWFCVT